MATNDVTIAGAGAGTRISGPLMPHRDDEVAVWLKAQRDEWYQSRDAYFVLDQMLDEYRLRADLGLSLTVEIPGEAQR